MTNTIIIIAVSLLVGFYYSYKIVELILSKRKFKDNKSEFNSDLYKLQSKWAKKGEVEYCKGISFVIDSFNLPPEEKQPVSDYGKDVLKNIEYLRKEELSEV